MARKKRVEYNKKIPLKQTDLRSFAGNKHFENASWWIIEKVVIRPCVYISVGIFVIACGLFLSVIGYDSAFQRSGSVLVALAILTVYFCFLVSAEYDVKQSMLKNYGELDNLEKVKAFLKKSMPEDAALQLHSTIKKSKESMPVLYKFINRLYFTEALFGIVGTLIWGFGDLPFVK